MAYDEIRKPNRAHGFAKSGDIGVERESFVSFYGPLGPVQASIFEPKTNRRACALIIPDVFGRSVFARKIAYMLSESGVTAVVPELFSDLTPVAEGDLEAGLDRLRKLNQSGTMLQLRYICQYIRASDTAQDVPLAVIGVSLGATLGLALSTFESFTSLVTFSAMINKKPSDNAPFNIVSMVPSIKVPLLCFWGEDDPAVSQYDISLFRAALNSGGIEPEIIMIAGVGHSVLELPEADGSVVSPTETWTRMMNFITVRRD